MEGTSSVDDVPRLQACISALSKENGELRCSFDHAQTIIERLQAKLRDTASALIVLPGGQEALDTLGIEISGDDVTIAAASCVAVEARVRNTLGEVLFRVFIDKPASHRELLSWFTPQFNHISGSGSIHHVSADLLAHNVIALCCGTAFEHTLDNVPLDEVVHLLTDVVAVVRLDTTVAHAQPYWLACISLDDSSTGARECNNLPQGDGTNTSSLTTEVQGRLSDAHHHHLHALLCTDILPSVVSFLGVSDITRMVGSSRNMRRAILLTYALPIATSRCLAPAHSASSSLVHSNQLFIVRPAIGGYIPAGAGGAGLGRGGPRPLRILDNSLHKLPPIGVPSGGDGIIHGGAVAQIWLPGSEVLSAVLYFELFAARMDQRYSFNHRTYSIILGPSSPSVVPPSHNPDPAAAAVPPRSMNADCDISVDRLFVPGATLDVLDTVRKWYDAVILEVAMDRILVHYNRWSNRWDEWVPLYSSAERADDAMDVAGASPSAAVEGRSRHPTRRRLLNPRLQPYRSMFDSQNDALKSDFRFFQIQWKRHGDSSGTHHERSTSFFAFSSLDEQKEVGEFLDARWQSDIIPAAFSQNHILLRDISGCRAIVRAAEERDMLSMVETSYISFEKLKLFLNPLAPRMDADGERTAWGGGHVDSDDDADQHVGRLEQGGTAVTSIMRLVELYNVDSVNAFFMVVNCLGEGLVYARYGARHWKHS